MMQADFARVRIGETGFPVLPRGVQLKRDAARGRWVLLAPERVLVPDATALDILLLCDGRMSVADIASRLAQKYAAGRAVVLGDILCVLRDLQDRKYLIDRGHPAADSASTARFAKTVAIEAAETERTGTANLPIAALAEVTHRCPLKCPYCSNPVALERAGVELSTRDWKRLMDEAAGLGVLQMHFSGGEPLAREDLADLVGHASGAGLYTNLITSGVLLDRERLAALAGAGLDHVQISFQGTMGQQADAIAGLKGAHRKKLDAARLTCEFGLPLTVNAVVHRRNLQMLPGLIEMAVELGAARLEVAHVQYLGWALSNRAALIPTAAQFEEANRIVEAARERLRGVLVIDYVIPDYYAVRPKNCMGGWGQKSFNITPSGKILPCHAAETITGLSFESARDHSLSWIWNESPAMQRYRGTGWMAEPCRSCEFREQDRGGCRCQAFALTGDAGATDPACLKSAHHVRIKTLAMSESEADDAKFKYRRFPKGG